jgi:arsenate reductase
MAEVGVDITGHRSTAAAEVDPETIDVVITLCAEEVCPTVLGAKERLHWPLIDPDRAHEALSDAARLEHFRAVRDDIDARLATLSL